MEDKFKEDDLPNDAGASEQPASGGAGLGDFFDALTAYAIDPNRWTNLLTQFDRLSERLQDWDPSELVAELSRAESLSWRIKQSGDPGQIGFAYLLLDDQDQVTGHSENLSLLAEYFSLSNSRQIEFSHPASLASLEAARTNLSSRTSLSGKTRGHSLVSFTHPDRPRQRFGFLISRSEFPPSLEQTAGDAVVALFIAQDDASDRLQNVVQASFGLTAAETDVTIKLAQGQSLKETAQDLEISVNTARNHLQSVFDKSGINRQNDLVLVVTQLSVILAGTESDQVAESRRKKRTPPRHFMILDDGRRLAYRTYGDVRGKPVLYLHETLGCSRLPPGTEELAVTLGLYLIAPERPGFGFSDVDADFSFDSVNLDLQALLDHLHIESCTLLGFLCGAAYALTLANSQPHRVNHLILVAGRPPQPMKGRFKHLMPLYTKMISQPWLMTSFFNILRNRASKETNAGLINSIYGSVPYDQKYLATHPDIFKHLVAYTMESMTVTAAGIAGELKCFARSASFQPEKLPMPISAWHGLADKIADIDDIDAFLSGQTVRWRRFENAGSMILFEHWPELMHLAAGTSEG